MQMPEPDNGTSALKRDYSKAKLLTPRSEKGFNDTIKQIAFEEQVEGMESNSVLDDSQRVINKKGLS